MSSELTEKKVRLPNVRKIERMCCGYIDHLEKGGSPINIQNILIMYILGSTDNTEYRTKLFNNWPTYLEDFDAAETLLHYKYPQTLCEELLKLKLDKSVKILDVACGPGNVAYILKDHGFTNIDGLDPSQGLLDAAQKKELYRNTFCCYVQPQEKTPIADETYDVLLCCAGMFPGSIVPQSFKELIRHVKIGGILAWNIADGYEGFNDYFLSYDEIIKQLIDEGIWTEVQPVIKMENMLFDDGAYTHIMKRLK